MVDAPSDRPASFNWTEDDIRRAGYATVDLIAAHLADLPN